MTMVRCPCTVIASRPSSVPFETVHLILHLVMKMCVHGLDTDHCWESASEEYQKTQGIQVHSLCKGSNINTFLLLQSSFWQVKWDLDSIWFLAWPYMQSRQPHLESHHMLPDSLPMKLVLDLFLRSCPGASLPSLIKLISFKQMTKHSPSGETRIYSNRNVWRKQ